jgi:glycosyltransferase involved in cell wall biosynthesis
MEIAEISKNEPRLSAFWHPKVMHVAPGYWACDPRLYHQECLSLVEAGYQVELAAHELPADTLDSRIHFHSLGPYGTPTLAWRLLGRGLRDRKAYLIARRSEAALYHFHAVEFIPWGCKLRAATGKPVIFDCREDFEGYARQRRGIPDLLRRPLACFVRNQLRRAACRCDAVIVADEGTGRLLRPYAKKIVILHNFPRLDLFTQLPFETEKPYDIIYHGSIPKYHLDVCLNIDAALVARGVHARWRLIGKMPEHHWFQRELCFREISDRFVISGVMPHSEVAKEVRKAKIGIVPLPDLPKFRNNIPRKLFEFMALGIPAVLSDLPPSRPFVGDNSCGFMVPPHDYEAYADAIIRLLRDPALRSKMGVSARQRIEAQFNWEKEFPKLKNLYQDLLS